MIPTSNHNQLPWLANNFRVVYLLIPTSNHNSTMIILTSCMLYIFWFLHKTTTPKLYLLFSFSCISFDSYIKPQLSFWTIFRSESCISFDSYIKPQREHQTSFGDNCCISFDSYIKPQLATALRYRSISCISFDSYIKPQL